MLYYRPIHSRTRFFSTRKMTSIVLIIVFISISTSTEVEIAPSDYCTTDCENSYRDKLRKYEANFVFNFIPLPPVLSASDVYTFCTDYFLYTDCLNVCAEGDVYDFDNPLAFICINKQKEFSSGLQCIKKVAPEIREKCSLECPNSTPTRYPYHVDIVSKRTIEYCNGQQCEIKCSSSLMTSICGTHQARTSMHYILAFLRADLSYMLEKASTEWNLSMAQATPPPCAELYCDRLKMTNKCDEQLRKRNLALLQ